MESSEEYFGLYGIWGVIFAQITHEDHNIENTFSIVAPFISSYVTVLSFKVCFSHEMKSFSL
jgi:hypothetical protein